MGGGKMRYCLQNQQNMKRFSTQEDLQMNLLKTILVAVFGVGLIACGGNEENSNSPQNQGAVQVATVENGVPKTADGRIILSSESSGSDFLTIPEGTFEGLEIHSSAVASHIAYALNTVLRVYNLSFESSVGVADVFPNINSFTLSFSVDSIHGTYNGIKCDVILLRPDPEDPVLEIEDCGSDQVDLELETYLRLKYIVVDRTQIRSILDENETKRTLN